MEHPFFLHPRLVDELRGLALAQVESGRHDLMFMSRSESVLPDVHKALEGSEGDRLRILDMSERLTGRKPADVGGALASLFRPDALEYLAARSANVYWFFYLLGKVQASEMPLDLPAAARAHARAKDSLRDNRYGFWFIQPSSLPYQLKQLPPGFLLEIWHKGLVLCDTRGGGEYRACLNPIILDR